MDKKQEILISQSAFTNPNEELILYRSADKLKSLCFVYSKSLVIVRELYILHNILYHIREKIWNIYKK